MMTACRWLWRLSWMLVLTCWVQSNLCLQKQILESSLEPGKPACCSQQSVKTNVVLSMQPHAWIAWRVLWRDVVARIPTITSNLDLQACPHLQGEPSVFVSEAADLAGRASERPRGTKNARQIAGRDYEHSSTCQVRRHEWLVVRESLNEIVTVSDTGFCCQRSQ